MFSQDNLNKVERRKDIEILNRFPLFGNHTTDVESETMKRLDRGGGRRRLGFFFFVTINIARYWNRPFTQVQIRAVMIVVRVQTVFGTAEKDWREGVDCWGLEDQKKVAVCAEKF